MDTDDLTPMAYESLSLAYDVSAPLRALIGVHAEDFHSEDDFLDGVRDMLHELVNTPEDYLNDWHGEELDETTFIEGLHMVMKHITVTRETPYAQRGKPDFA